MMGFIPKFKSLAVWAIGALCAIALVGFNWMNTFVPGISQPEPMGAYLNGTFPITTPTGSTNGNVSYSAVNAFPNLTFIDPVDMAELPGTNEFIIVGLRGHIWKFKNEHDTAQKELLLDVSNNVASGADGGMLGVVLHPEYGQAGSPNAEYIYVYYRYSPDLSVSSQLSYMRLSRFNLPLGSNRINPSSEYVLMNIYDRHDWHNGGGMFFGPEDGFLYLSIGDEGGAWDYSRVAQQIDKWMFSGIVRIDVDRRGGNISHPIRKQPLNRGTPPAGWPNSYTQGYYIPNDNPWLDPNGGILEEFYAIGARSPHRMSYDAATGDIWLGDVGQGSYEEINLVRKGDNLQWPFREGHRNGLARPASIIGTERPALYAYGRSVGSCVIGGLVYRGNRYPELKGKYLFADHTTQNISTITKTGENSGDVNFLMHVPFEGQGAKDGISSFFEDSQGHLYVLDLFGSRLDGGVVRKLVREGPMADPPSKLSELGVFDDLETLEPRSGIIPFDVNAPLWSDRAVKQRWIALPNDGTFDTASEQIGFDRENNWTFPEGTVLIKQFNLPTDASDPTKVVRLETRFIVFIEDGGAYGVTYKWNEEQTDAFLIGINEAVSQEYTVRRANGSTYTQKWDFPTRNQCMQCHNNVAGHALGLKTRQLNKDLLYPASGITSNQLKTWEHLHIFDSAIGDPAKLPASAHINDTNASREMRVRSYIDANCAYCHRPSGVDGAFDGRAMTALYDQMMIDQDVISNASQAGGKILIPQDHFGSELYKRDSSTESNKMPPVGKNMNDDDYLSVLIGWIDNLELDGPKRIDDGWYTIASNQSDKFLSVAGSSQSENAKVVQTGNIVGLGGNWHFQEMGNGKYRIMAVHSEMALSLDNLRPDSGAHIVQGAWAGEQHQLWDVKENSEGDMRLGNGYN
ncbi:MAG: PQQ-dependent sugar dehydrogenase, partial [Flavobacteriaceae bacterium]